VEILVTGSRGFIGRNLVARLRQCGYADILEYDLASTMEQLDDYTRRCGFIFHLAGVNRPDDPADYMEGNAGFTQALREKLSKYSNKSPILLSSSAQALLDNPYGESKRASESLIFAHSDEMGTPVFVYRLPNVFGKWCRPNYNSAVATFCHNIAHGLPILVNNEETALNLVHVDDVAAEFIRALEGQAQRERGFCVVQPVFTAKLGRIAELIESFQECRKNLKTPQLSDIFIRKLYSTYLSYLPERDLSYSLKANRDDRGSFTEFLRMDGCGQVSINISKPGITKGNHWHHTKNEKFLVVSGEGIIRFRAIENSRVVEYRVNGDEMRVIDIPPGYSHSIENTGGGDMVTVMWASDCYDPEDPDTYALEV